jgi:acyl-coenzyme A thioesterase PaaI-like protein
MLTNNDNMENYFETISILKEKILQLELELEKSKAKTSIIHQPRPNWFNELLLKSNYNLLEIKEWIHENERNNDGFKGYDFMHSKNSPVHIIDYILKDADNNNGDITSSSPILIGCVYFSDRAESHRNLCHGGTMCGVMDDIIGWMGFCNTGHCIQWSGFTVQVDTSLKKPVTIGSTLRLEAKIIKREGKRKIWIEAMLTNDTKDFIYCEGKGLFLSNNNNNSDIV